MFVSPVRAWHSWYGQEQDEGANSFSGISSLKAWRWAGRTGAVWNGSRGTPEYKPGTDLEKANQCQPC